MVPVMKQLTNSSFHYYGERPYVNAIHVFECFLAEVVDTMPRAYYPQVIRSFKIFKEITYDGGWWLIDGLDEPKKDAGKPTATLLFNDVSGNRRHIDLIDIDVAVARREADLVTSYTDLEYDGDFSGSARLPATASPAEVFKEIVQINKALHLETLRRDGQSGGEIRYIYMENYSLPDFNIGNGQGYKFKFKHLGLRLGNDRTYTLCRITNELAPEQSPITLCYSYALDENS